MNDTRLANRCTQQAEAQVVVAVTGIIVVAIGRTRVRRIVVPAAAPIDPVRA